MQNFGASPIILHRFKHCRGNSRIARIGITHKLPQNQLKQLAPLVRGAVFCEAKRLRGSYIFKLFCISPSVIFFENATFLVRGRQRLIYNLSVTNLAILLSSLSVAKDLKMATHETIRKIYTTEILRFAREWHGGFFVTRLEMLPINYIFNVLFYWLYPDISL